MNNLTKKAYTRAWTVCFVERQNGGKLALGELREAYERDTRFIAFLSSERGQIRQGLALACVEFLGAVSHVSAANATDDTVFDGIGFRPRKKMAGKPELWIESQTTINVNSGFNEKGGLSTVGVATPSRNFVMEVYLAHNEQRTGPHTAAEVQAMVAANEIDRSCLAWREGMTDWLPLGEVVPFTVTPPPSPFPAGLPPIPVRPAKKTGSKSMLQNLEKRLEASPVGPLLTRDDKWVGPIIGAILIMLVTFGCHH